MPERRNPFGIPPRRIPRVPGPTQPPVIAQPGKANKLINNCGLLPEAKWVTDNLDSIAKTPFFDGTVLKAMIVPEGKTEPHHFGFSIFGLPYTIKNAKDTIKDLRALDITINKYFPKPYQTNFKHNFLHIATSNTGLDWFDEYTDQECKWDDIIKNFIIAARIAKEGRLKGLYFDPEPYGALPPDYTKLDPKTALFMYKGSSPLSIKEYQKYKDQAKLRGKQLIEAINSAYEDITILFAFMYSQLWNEKPYHIHFIYGAYGLLPAFLDGIIQYKNSKTKLIDGSESTYPYKFQSQECQNFNQWKYQTVPSTYALFSAPELGAKNKVQIGFATDLDYPNGQLGFFDINKREVENTVYASLKTTEEYSWLYADGHNWWGVPSPNPAEKQGVFPPDYAKQVNNGKMKHLSELIPG